MPKIEIKFDRDKQKLVSKLDWKIVFFSFDCKFSNNKKHLDNCIGWSESFLDLLICFFLWVIYSGWKMKTNLDLVNQEKSNEKHWGSNDGPMFSNEFLFYSL